MDKLSKPQIKRCLSLSILFFSGTGFRLIPFEGSIIVYFFILFLLNPNNLKKVYRKDIAIILGLNVIIAVFFFIKSDNIPYFLFVAMASAYLVLLNYRVLNYKERFLTDITLLLRFYMFYTLGHIFFLFFGRSLFGTTYIQDWFRQIGYVFWYIDSGGPSFFNHYRLSGLAWEPGIWQMFLNLNLILALYHKRSIKEIVLSILAIIFTFSTTGLFILIFVIAAYFLYIRPLKNITVIIIPSLLLLSLSTLILGNIEDKLHGKGLVSSVVRFSDFYIGAKMLERSPFIGEDPKSTLDSSDKMILNERQRIWDNSEAAGQNSEGFMEAEIVNGFMIFLLDFGLPLGLFLFYKTFSFNLFNDRKLKNIFIITILITLNTEPISRTGFFYFFVLSSLLIKPSKINYKIGGNRTFILNKTQKRIYE